MPEELPTRARRPRRIAYALVYACTAALAVALCARPAAIFVRGLGLAGPVLPARAPLGGPALALLALIFAFTLRFALALARGGRPRVPEHAAFLLLFACALGLRGMATAPLPARDPAASLEAALAAVADALEQGYAARGTYAADESALDALLATLPAPGFVLRGRALPLRARVLEEAPGPQLAVRAGDLPGTLYVAESTDRRLVFLSALTLASGHAAVLAKRARPVVVQLRGGTHGPVGRDPLLPAYPGMRTLARPRPTAP